jgi:transcriptional regulator with XRE-family HTH domain
MHILALVQSHEALAAALTIQRKRAGFSMEEIAQRARLEPGFLARLERGTITAGEHLEAWLDALNIEFVLVDRAEATTSMLSDLPNSPTTYHKIRKKVAAKGGRQRFANLSDARRRERAREIARNAGRARQTKLQQDRERENKTRSFNAAKSAARERACPPPTRAKRRARKAQDENAPAAI